MKILCSINARGGSKGVKNKNTRLINGIPLIAITLRQAKEAGIFNAIIVSSDSESILSVAKKWGADFVIRRPDELASDTAPKIPAIRYSALEAEKLVGYEFDIICDLDATSPLRTVEDINNCIALLQETKQSNVITACESRKSPYFNMVELNEQRVPVLSKKLKKNISRRQDAPVVYELNASIYVWWKEKLLTNDTVFFDDTSLYVMPPERSIDIDSESDFDYVSYLLNNRSDIKQLFI